MRDIPDFEHSFEQYFSSNRNKEDWQKVQRWVDMLPYPEEKFRSKNLIDLPFLKTLLQSCGFKVVRFWYEKEELCLDCVIES
jgi:hypothetical protein